MDTLTILAMVLIIIILVLLLIPVVLILIIELGGLFSKLIENIDYWIHIKKCKIRDRKRRKNEDI